MASLAHTQVHWTQLIQISDLFGEYGVDFVVMLVAAAITCIVFRPRRWWAIAPAAFALAATLIYGEYRIAESQPVASGAGRIARIALIQGNSLAEWKFDPAGERQIMQEYIKLSEQAIEMAKHDGQPVDLIVWPETMFRTSMRTGLVSFDPEFEMPSAARYTKEEFAAFGPNELASVALGLNAPILVGIERAHYPAAQSSAIEPRPSRYNAAVLVDRDGILLGTYDKIHRVMFGEYIPFAEYFPFLYGITPLTGGIEAGREPGVLQLNDNFYAPSICYETVFPHVIRRQALATAADSDGKPADVLINLTNDAWYWGSNELDQHLACGVFRAVETRRPLVIAANGGISAWIDRTGAVRARSPKQEPDVILADVEIGYLDSWYVQFGDWFAMLCLTLCVVFAIIGWRRGRGSE
jgi:apolipoprotein N-acyltransferase